ncbi:hypothetical protein L2E82_23247 [Cichorium intybus]|uniref:Uncharacterized protein n=1 Tax=Cichorium intybus TaxID=13427 RepID=A0ACB9DZG5_CICIN|nr:hypothetical protein L2E82_23247 [Cichorium intybus]
MSKPSGWICSVPQETILFKLEVLDHKARERVGVITPTLGSPIPVLLTFDAAVEALQALSIQYGRERWLKPVLRRYAACRIENNVQSFEKLRQVRRNLYQAKNLLEALIKVVFAEYSSKSLFHRIMDCKPKIVVTCNAVKRGKKVPNLKDIVDAALLESSRNGVSIGGYIRHLFDICH